MSQGDNKGNVSPKAALHQGPPLMEAEKYCTLLKMILKKETKQLRSD